MRNRNGVAVPHSAPAPLGLATAEGSGGDPGDSLVDERAFPGIPTGTTYTDLVDYFARRRREGVEPLIDEELSKLRIREQAKLRYAAEQAAESGTHMPTPVTLTEFLAVPDEDANMRIGDLLPVGGRAMLAAQFKAGKSTLRDNLVRSIADNTPFLGQFHIAPIDGNIAVIDNELDERMLRRWMRDQGIQKTDRVTVVPLRGKVSSFNILDATIRTAWAQALQGCSFLVFDCLRPVLDSLGLSEDKDAGRFLVAFDELLTEAGISEAVLIHHMGHSSERSRGDSRLQDWPDVLWRIVREKDTEGEAGPEAKRFFSAYGRDVDVREGELAYTPESRTLMFVAGSRKESAARGLIPAVVAYLRDEGEGRSGNAIEKALMASGHPKMQIRGALKHAIADSLVYTTPGPRNAILHVLNPAHDDASSPVRQTSPPARQRTENEFASSPLCGELELSDQPASSPTQQPGELKDVWRISGQPIDKETP
ncbi:AAA family ATPase [Rhodococcoides fascians]|uniref:AAA family ATPase n=1 Tax=Rhodococcoides fascians TaxID=1828 RepID=UPI00050BF7A0|nr:AAA family ATPase [Rhodococcus fascians]